MKRTLPAAKSSTMSFERSSVASASQQPGGSAAPLAAVARSRALRDDDARARARPSRPGHGSTASAVTIARMKP